MSATEHDSLRIALFKLEMKLMDPGFRWDSGEAAMLLAEDFVEFGSSGRVWSRAEILAPGESAGPIVAVEDFAVRMLATGLAQATYRSVRAVPGNGPFVALRSSLWVYRDGRWQMVFHQGTKVPDA